ncbi:hypothetical protein QL285_012839 [Trifolium repens]|nr:hypothetical protein QL285_012839 [Trifolium repens]
MSNDFATLFPSKEKLYILRLFPNCLDDLNAPDLTSAPHVLQPRKLLLFALKTLDSFVLFTFGPKSSGPIKQSLSRFERNSAKVQFSPNYFASTRRIETPLRNITSNAL